MKKRYLALMILTLFACKVQAQQDPHYTQYMYNMNVINPAYAGSKESIAGSILYRQQWSGMDGAPKTGTFAIHSPVGKNVGLGLSFISDEIGPVTENNVYADFSYTLKMGGEHRLAFGLKAGATFQDIGLFSDINESLPQPADDLFKEDTNNTFFNVGTGIFYYTQKYYLAFSVPNMLKNTYLNVDEDGNEVNYGTDEMHYFLTGGYVFQISDNTKLKPSFMLKSTFDMPASLDVSANVLFHEKFEIGATYRTEDSFGAMVNFAVTPSIRIGYAYDHIISDLDAAVPSTHEFMLLFDLNTPKKVSISPRYF